MPDMPIRIHILYATATGTAEDVSQLLAENLFARGAHLQSLQTFDEYPLTNLPTNASNDDIFIFVVSTCGDGQTPITMRNFWNFLRRSDLPEGILSRLRFAIFGLGDRGYVKFNAAARKLCTRLLDLGASLLTPLALGDDSEEGGYDTQLLPWMEKLQDTLFPDLNSVPEKEESVKQSRIRVQILEDKAVPLHSSHKWGTGEAKYKPRPATRQLYDSTVSHIKLLTNSEFLSDDKQVLHIELDITNSTLATGLDSYEPGDVIYVMPKNSRSAIDAFFELTSFEKDTIIAVQLSDSKSRFGGYRFNIDTPCTLEAFVSAQLDFNAPPRRSLFKRLAPFATLELEREKLLHFASTEGAEDMTQYAYREKRTVLLVLRDFPSARPPLEHLIDMIPILRPRAFSIASSAVAHPGEIHICASIVQYLTPLRFQRVGVCSSFFKSLSKGDCVPIFLEEGRSLRFEMNRPSILVGPGTGVAPMRSFLSAAKCLRVNRILFFGCRTKRGDFLYQTDFSKLTSEGKLTELITAFSRSNSSVKKIYVQDKMVAKAKRLWDMIHESNALVYVAGAAGEMPKGVRQVIVDICHSAGGLSVEAGETYVKRMEAEGRLQMECW